MPPFLWEKQEWESHFFGREIYRLSEYGIPQYRIPTQGVLLTAKVSADDSHLLDALQKQGLNIVETALDFELVSDDFDAVLAELGRFSHSSLIIREALAQDIPALTSCFSRAFPATRFRPPYFSIEENHRFYAQWLENAVHRVFDDRCLLAQTQDGIIGAVTLRKEGDAARLGLLAVVDKAQRQGIARILLREAVQWCRNQKRKSLSIATQSNNTPAIKLYQSLPAQLKGEYCWLYQSDSNILL